MNPVFLWAPNLIGYGRIVSAALAFYFANQPLIGASLYVSSQLLDSVDGHVARALGQSSRFGAVLDMLTDRMSSMVLMLLLGKFYPEFDFCFTWLVVLDVVAHWCQMYSKLIAGVASHKDNTNAILKFYYGFPTLFLTCFGNEAFFVLLYIYRFAEGPEIAQLGIKSVFKPGTPMKLVELGILVSFPVFAFKQLTNVIQLVDASSSIAEGDYSAYLKKKAEKKKK